MAKGIFLVTHNSNVTSKGELINEEDIGYVIDSYLVPFMTVNPETGENIQGLLSKIAVLWEQRRTPSPSFHAPEELTWLELEGIDTDDDDADLLDADGNPIDEDYDNTLET